MQPLANEHLHAKRPWRWLRRMLRVLAVLALILIAAIVLFWCMVRIPDPVTSTDTLTLPTRVQGADGRWHIGRQWSGRNAAGLYEVYVEGDALQRGMAYGVLTSELVQRQERVFIDRLCALVPDQRWLGTLKYITAWFNRDLPDHVPLEFQREIFGVSFAFSDSFDFIGPKYHRALNYHAAHDIGHALQDLALVGCTSFACWDSATADGGLLIGRNFDFSLGEAFAQDKLVTFIKPEHGIPFMTVAWGGFMGAASGMNREGLTVTINAARSTTPWSARTPISLLAREILQYAATIDSAIAIARRRDVFVSESILVGSAHDHRAVIIEKAPDGMDVATTTGDRLVCANHYQSARFRDAPANTANKKESDSMARFKRMNELLDARAPLDPAAAVGILRDRSGPGGTDVGLGNPMCINQLIAHHSVVFQPGRLRVWVSIGPWQEGAFVCYDLARVFDRCATGSVAGPIEETALTLPADSFLLTPDFRAYQHHARVHEAIHDHLLSGKPYPLTAEDERAFVDSDPKCYLTHADLGDLRFAEGDRAAAIVHYTNALTCTVASEAERQRITVAIARCTAR